LNQGQLKVTEEEFEKFQKFIQAKIGLKFPENKKTLLESRLSVHISRLGFESYGEYFDFLETQSEFSEEIEFVIDKITTHTTSFFREDHHFNFLTSQGIDIIQKNFGKSTVIKFASLGSSTGEEMYTISMVLYPLKKNGKIKDYSIDAFDISKYALLNAKEGRFRLETQSSIPTQFQNLFKVADNKLLADQALKNNMKFFMSNIAKKNQRFPDNYHIVFCRNTLIYFNKTLQQNVIDNIANILLPGGLYFMGHSESLNGLTHNFKRVEPTIYLR